LLTVEKLFSHVAIEMPIVKADAHSEYKLWKASSNCSNSFVALSNDESERSFFCRKLTPTLDSAANAPDCMQ